MALLSVRRYPKIENILIVVAVTGVAMMIAGYLISPLLVERDRAIFESLSTEDPNWLHYRDLGDAFTVYFYFLIAGSFLVILSLVVTVLYYSMTHDFTYKLKGNLDRLKLNGSNIA